MSHLIKTTLSLLFLAYVALSLLLTSGCSQLDQELAAGGQTNHPDKPAEKSTPTEFVGNILQFNTRESTGIGAKVDITYVTTNGKIHIASVTRQEFEEITETKAVPNIQALTTIGKGQIWLNPSGYQVKKILLWL